MAQTISSDGTPGASGPAGPGSGILDVKLCQVGGVNHNYVSKSGTQYHIQVEDRGPVMDCVTDSLVRRVNMIIYANYGEPNARIIYGQDYDWDDVRTGAYNRQIEQRIQELVAASRVIIEEKEERQVGRIKALIRRYYHTKDESVKREFEDSNALYPFLFSRAWAELRREREERQAQPKLAAEAPEMPAWEALGLVEVEPERSRRPSRRRCSIRWIPSCARV